MKLRNPFTNNELPYSEQEIADYIRDLERITVLRDKSQKAGMVEDAAEYDTIISNMKVVLSFMTERNQNVVEDKSK